MTKIIEEERGGRGKAGRSGKKNWRKEAVGKRTMREVSRAKDLRRKVERRERMKKSLKYGREG